MKTVSLGSMGASWGGEWHGIMPLACPWLPVVLWADCFKKCSAVLYIQIHGLVRPELARSVGILRFAVHALSMRSI